MKSQEQLKREIMGRVYLGYVLRRVWSFATLRFAVFAGAVVGIISSVSIRHVIENMPDITDFGASYDFASAAVKNTEFAVQASLLVVFVSVIYTTFGVLKGRTFSRNTFA